MTVRKQINFPLPGWHDRPKIALAIFGRKPPWDASNYPVSITSLNALILSGQTDSASANIYGMTLVGLSIPSGFVGTTLTIQGSIDGVTFKTLYKDGADLVYTVAPNKLVVVQPTDLISVSWVKITAGSSQTADQTIGLVLRAV